MTTIDEAKLGSLVEQFVGHMTGGAVCFATLLGDELGLYQVLDGAGGMTADEVAGKAGCNARLVREWLDGQVAAGLIAYDAEQDSYELGPEAAMVLSHAFLPIKDRPAVFEEKRQRAKERERRPGDQ